MTIFDRAQAWLAELLAAIEEQQREDARQLEPLVHTDERRVTVEGDPYGRTVIIIECDTDHILATDWGHDVFMLDEPEGVN